VNDDYALCVVGRSASFSQSSRSALCDRVVVAMSIRFFIMQQQKCYVRHIVSSVVIGRLRASL